MTTTPDRAEKLDLSLLQLERPLAVIDLESTGLRPETARIVRVSILLVTEDGAQTLRSELVNPGLPVPPGATAVHGISDEDVADRPLFRAYARALAKTLGDCDLAGFGIERFHLPLLQAEFRRAGVEFSVEGRAVIDTMAIFHRLEPRDFPAAFTRYAGDGTLPDRKSGSRAGAVLAILLGELAAEPDLPRDAVALAQWSRGVDEDAVDPEGRFVKAESGDILFNFGQYRGEAVDEIVKRDFEYLEWIATNSKFGAGARKIAERAVVDYRTENG